MIEPVEMDVLRKTAEELARRWNVQLSEELPGATCSLIAAGLDAGRRDVVLKVPQPHAEEKEAYPVLQAFSRHVVLQVDEPSGAVLMPRLNPGQMLCDTTLTDLEQVKVCASLILQLRQCPQVPAIPMERWLRELFVDTEDELMLKAQPLARELLATTETTTLLHGDLHQYNILSHGGEWKVIDPKGIIGDPAFEVVGFIRNPWPGPHSPEKMRSRLQRFHEVLGDDPYRLWAWSFVQTVLCSIGDEPNDTDMRNASEALWQVRKCFGSNK